MNFPQFIWSLPMWFTLTKYSHLIVLISVTPFTNSSVLSSSRIQDSHRVTLNHFLLLPFLPLSSQINTQITDKESVWQVLPVMIAVVWSCLSSDHNWLFLLRWRRIIYWIKWRGCWSSVSLSLFHVSIKLEPNGATKRRRENFKHLPWNWTNLLIYFRSSLLECPKWSM